MAHSTVLSDSVSTIDLRNYGSQFILDGGHAWQNGVLDIRIRFDRADGTQATYDQLEAAVNAIRCMLLDASMCRADTRQRRHTLTDQPNGAALATIWDVIGGSVETPLSWSREYRVNHAYEALIHLAVEPYTRSAEVTPLSGATLYPMAAGWTHHYVATGASGTGVDGSFVGPTNMIAVRDGRMDQTSKFTASPTTQAMANQLAWYWGNTLAKPDRIGGGIRTAKTGSWSGVWEIWTGSAWSSIATTSEFRSGAEGTEFDTVKELGAVSITGSTASWALKTISGVTAYWIRYRITSYTSGAAPVRTNGPWRSYVGLGAIANTAIPGDFPAPSLLHLTNPGATALAGVRAGVAVGRRTTVSPPLVLDWQGIGTDGSDYIPTGDITAALATDSTASLGEAVDLTLAANLSDRAQILDGVSQYITATVGASDKIGLLGSGSFLIEMTVKLSSLPNSPFPLLSQWTTTDANCVFWWGIDQGKMRATVYSSGSKKKSVNGATTIAVGEYVTLALFFNAPAKTISLYYNTGLDASGGAGGTSLRTGQTTALRIGSSAGFDAADSRDGASTETFAPMSVGYCWIQKDTLDNIFGAGHYPGPDTKRSTEGYAAGANLVLLWEMEDSAASTTITDSAGTPKNGARSAGNTSANTTAGPFVAGVNGTIRAIGQTAPTTLSTEWAGTYQAYQLVRNAGTLTSLDDLAIGLQWSVGDVLLGTQSGLRKLPALAVPTNGWYVLDMGPVTLPPSGLYQGHAGSGSGRLALGANLIVRHRFASPTVIRLGPLILIPTMSLCSYETFRSTYNAAYAIAQNTGLAFDGRGPEPLVYQTTTGGLTVETRNPYGKPNAARPLVQPKKVAFVYALPLRPDATNNVVFANLADSLTATVKAVPRFEGMAAA